MRFHRITNQPIKTPYAPTWDYTLGTTFFPINLEKLSKTCLEKEKEIKRLPTSKDWKGNFTDGYTGLGKNSTTSRFQSYNVLEWNTPESNSLLKSIKSQLRVYNHHLGNSTPEHVWISCWVNILRWSQHIKPHKHSTSPDCYLSGHFNVQVKDTSTCYMSPVNQLNDPEIIEVKNIPGEMNFFPSYIFHYTTPHYSFKPRITIAMDIHVSDFISSSTRVDL